MARKYQNQKSGHRILVVDDSPEVLESTRSLLELEGHRVVVARDGMAALDHLGRERFHLVLVDYFMPWMRGDELVRRIREADEIVQIIMVTGYAGEKPARGMMRELAIQGYHDKGDGPDRLLLWVDMALKAYRHFAGAARQREGLRFILDAAPEMYRLQPLDDLLRGLLWQMEALLGAGNGFLATREEPRAEREGFVAASTDPGDGMEIRFGTGRFRPGMSIQDVPEPERADIARSLSTGEPFVSGSCSVVPLRIAERTLGVVYLDRPPAQAEDTELLEAFGHQAAAALHNALLYELATVDPATGTHVRDFLMQHLRQALKRGQRTGSPLALIMVDVDRFKRINDGHGHPTGDRALEAVAHTLRESVRDTDLVGRYGGDEFIVLLPDTPPEGAATVANRIHRRSSTLELPVENGSIPISLSVGVACMPPGSFSGLGHGRTVLDHASRTMIQMADDALYRAKRGGGGIQIITA
jgi:two-component system, cell cycle response regulator